MKKRNHNRRPENDKISVSMPVALIDELDKIAMQQDRSRSKVIARILTAQIDKYNHQQTALTVAEDQADYICESEKNEEKS